MSFACQVIIWVYDANAQAGAHSRVDIKDLSTHRVESVETSPEGVGFYVMDENHSYEFSVPGGPSPVTLRAINNELLKCYIPK